MNQLSKDRPLTFDLSSANDKERGSAGNPEISGMSPNHLNQDIRSTLDEKRYSRHGNNSSMMDNELSTSINTFVQLNSIKGAESAAVRLMNKFKQHQPPPRLGMEKVSQDGSMIHEQSYSIDQVQKSHNQTIQH